MANGKSTKDGCCNRASGRPSSTQRYNGPGMQAGRTRQGSEWSAGIKVCAFHSDPDTTEVLEGVDTYYTVLMT